MPVKELILNTVVWPALAAAAVLALARVPAVARSRAAALVAPLAIAAGFLAGYWGAAGLPALVPPAQATARLPDVAVIGIALAVIATWRARRAVVWTATAIAAVAAMRLVFGTSVAEQWSAGGATLRIGALAAGMACTALVTGDLCRRLPPAAAGLALAGLAGVAAPLMALSASVLLAQLHGALGVAATAVAIAVWRAPDRVAITAAWPVVAALAWAMWAIALLFADLPPWSFVLLIAAAPTALATSAVLRRATPRRRATAALLALALITISSVAVGGLRYTHSASAGAASSPRGDSSSYGYGYSQ